jgi:hypothetical protein
MTTRRKSSIVKDVRGSAKEPMQPTVIDYTTLSAEDLGAHMLDEGGLLRFVNVQMQGVPREEWNWAGICRSIWALSGKQWLLTEGTAESIYEEQLRDADH